MPVYVSRPTCATAKTKLAEVAVGKSLMSAGPAFARKQVEVAYLLARLDERLARKSQQSVIGSLVATSLSAETQNPEEQLSAYKPNLRTERPDPEKEPWLFNVGS